MLTRDYFTKPLPIGCTTRKQTVNEKNEIEYEDVKIIFYLNRETVAQMNGQSIFVAMIQKQAEEGYPIVFERFCQQMGAEPVGFEDFPKDERPLVERAREYFAPEGFTDLILWAMEEFRRIQNPSDLFRGI